MSTPSHEGISSWPQDRYEGELHQRIQSYLDSPLAAADKVWVNGRWDALPRTDKASMCYKAFIEIMNKIAKDFGLDQQRVAIDTKDRSIPHLTMGLQPPTEGLTTRPDFSVVGVGECLSPFRDMGVVESNLTYRNIRSVIDLKNNQEVRSRDSSYDVGIQLACYAREQLYEQPNRLFVDSLAVSYQYMRLFCFDRAGPSFFDCVDIHAYPVLFVQAILLMFADDAAIGLDESVEYDSDSSPQVSATVTGTLDISHCDSERAPPEIPDADSGAELGSLVTRLRRTSLTQSHSRPDSLKITGLGLNRSSIFGRGTTCWYVEDAISKEKYIVKDYWRASTRPSEAAILLAGSGLSGVGEVYAFQDLVPVPDFADDTGMDGAYNTISGIRGYDVMMMLTLQDPKARRHTGHTLSNRDHCRIISRRYYGDLSTAFNYTCLLVAFRDAVVGKPIA